MIFLFHRSGAIDTVESFDLNTKTWNWEPSFPFVPIYGSTSIPYGNTFMTVGGYYGNNKDYVYMVTNFILWK